MKSWVQGYWKVGQVGMAEIVGLVIRKLGLIARLK